MARIAVITVSDSCSAGTNVDETGPATERALIADGNTVVSRCTVADERDEITKAIVQAAESAEVVLTNGGTGPGPRDVTPEATRDAIVTELPGIGEAMRAAGRANTALAAISRQAAGITSNGVVVVNLPGSPKGALECLAVVTPLLEHLIATIKGARH